MNFAINIQFPRYILHKCITEIKLPQFIILSVLFPVFLYQKLTSVILKQVEREERKNMFAIILVFNFLNIQNLIMKQILTSFIFVDKHYICKSTTIQRSHTYVQRCNVYILRYILLSCANNLIINNIYLFKRKCENKYEHIRCYYILREVQTYIKPNQR